MSRRRARSNDHSLRYKFAKRDCPLRFASPRSAQRNRDNQGWCRAILSASSSFAFGRSQLLQSGLGLSFIVVKLHDAQKVLRGVIQCQRRGEIVAEKQEDQRGKHHDATLRGVAGLRSHLHEPDLRRGHAQRNDIDWPVYHRQMRHRVRLGKVTHPEKTCMPQFDRLSKHREQTKENWESNHHGETTSDRIDAVLLVHLHHFLIHARRIVFVFFAQLLHLGREQRSLAHGTVGLGLKRPKYRFDDGGQRKDGGAVTSEQGAQRIQSVEQNLANNLKDPEIHDLGLVMLEEREAMINLRTGINLESRAVSLAGPDLETRHVQCTLASIFFFCRLHICAMSPHAVGFGTQRRNEGRNKLVCDRDPFSAVEVLLIKLLRCVRPHSEKTATPTKPTDIDSRRPAVDAPGYLRERWIICRMKRDGRTKRQKIAGALVWLCAAVAKIDI